MQIKCNDECELHLKNNFLQINRNHQEIRGKNFHGTIKNTKLYYTAGFSKPVLVSTPPPLDTIIVIQSNLQVINQGMGCLMIIYG